MNNLPLDSWPLWCYIIPKMNEIKHTTIRTFNPRTRKYNYHVYACGELEAIELVQLDWPNTLINGTWPYILDVCRPQIENGWRKGLPEAHQYELDTK